jgi:hypothetical protein
MIRWVEGSHMNLDVPADVCLLSDSALSEKGGSMFVGDQRNCLVVQERARFPHKANGYYGAVSTTEVVASFLDKMRKGLKKKALAH